jgi:hypothetical protein
MYKNKYKKIYKTAIKKIISSNINNNDNCEETNNDDNTDDNDYNLCNYINIVDFYVINNINQLINNVLVLCTNCHLFMGCVCSKQFKCLCKPQDDINKRCCQCCLCTKEKNDISVFHDCCCYKTLINDNDDDDDNNDDDVSTNNNDKFIIHKESCTCKCCKEIMTNVKCVCMCQHSIFLIRDYNVLACTVKKLFFNKLHNIFPMRAFCLLDNELDLSQCEVVIRQRVNEL